MHTLFSRYLDNNQLETIEEGAFDNLGSLISFTAANNLITHVPAFGTHPYLQYVAFGSNNIETVADSAFASCPSLRYL